MTPQFTLLAIAKTILCKLAELQYCTIRILVADNRAISTESTCAMLLAIEIVGTELKKSVARIEATV